MTSNSYACMIFASALMVLSNRSAFAQAQSSERPAQAPPSGFHADAEIDPFAYAFGGYSVHVGVGYRSLRVSLGAFALELPGFLEPNDAFQSSRNGYGMKVQYFPFSEQSGGFFGVQAELADELIESEQSDAAHRERKLNLGLHIGWRFMLGDFFVTPWLLVNYTVDAADVHLDGKTYEATALFPSPVVHVGYRFR